MEILSQIHFSPFHEKDIYWLWTSKEETQKEHF